MSNLCWKRDKGTGNHFAQLGERKVARVVRLSASAWRWSYRGPREARATVGGARLLKHAKEAVQRLHDSEAAAPHADGGAS